MVVIGVKKNKTWNQKIKIKVKKHLGSVGGQPTPLFVVFYRDINFCNLRVTPTATDVKGLGVGLNQGLTNHVLG
jgi:hypothetical protein